MLADQVDYVVGVDTHRDEHVLAVVVAPSGAVVAQRSVGASGRGYAEALRFADEHAVGRRVWAVEGAGHYGAGFARHLNGRGETVVEAGRSPRGERRLQGKDDQLDAARAARTVLASETSPAAPGRATTGGAAAADGRSQECGRCPSRGARAATERDRDRTRRAPRRAAGAACGTADPALQPVPPLELAHPRRARHDARAAHPRPSRPGRDRGSSRTTGRDPRPRPRARTHVARRARCRTDRRRPGHRQLVPQRPRPLRSRLRPPRRRRSRSRPPRARRPSSGSAAAATASSTEPSTPSSSTAGCTTPQPRTTSPAASPKERPPATPSASSSATSPATSTASSTTSRS